LFFSLSSILYFFVPNKPLVIRTCVVWRLYDSLACLSRRI
jgi:hypothetical protein